MLQTRITWNSTPAEATTMTAKEDAAVADEDEEGGIYEHNKMSEFGFGSSVVCYLHYAFTFYFFLIQYENLNPKISRTVQDLASSQFRTAFDYVTTNNTLLRQINTMQALPTELTPQGAEEG
ncbi:unnamed protein product [Heligmosomoides polygyrus]|uniref:Elf4 domain-containing protein n=1 Tax=Heligmosomoides polygyrus TaxID=6339 RepID=A0A183FCE2_HELPZ|nr:unnamed protein product [Heligmosomoides polygyrus]